MKREARAIALSWAVLALTGVGAGCTSGQGRFEPVDESKGRRGGTAPVTRPAEEMRAPDPDAPPDPSPPAKTEPMRGTRRAGAGGVNVDEHSESSLEPTPCRIEIRTWSDERIVGILLERGDLDYQVDVTGDGPEASRKVRKIPRRAIMSEECRPLSRDGR